MKKNLKTIIDNDLYRYYGGGVIKLWSKISVPQLKFLNAYRKTRFYKSNSMILYLVNKYKLKKLSNKYHIQISENVDIGYGLRIDHFGRIIINSKVKIGNNCTLNTGIVIGQENRGKRLGVPQIGNEVWIGANAVVVGNISIGNNVLIAPNSFVNFDVPNNSIVLGNPGKIIHNDEATKNYIVNTVITKENK